MSRVPPGFSLRRCAPCAPSLPRVFGSCSRRVESRAPGRGRVRRARARRDRGFQVSLPTSGRAGPGRPSGRRHRRRHRRAAVRCRHVGTHVLASRRGSRLRPERTSGAPRGSAIGVALSAAIGTLPRIGANRAWTYRAITRSGLPFATDAAPAVGSRHR